MGGKNRGMHLIAKKSCINRPLIKKKGSTPVHHSLPSPVFLYCCISGLIFADVSGDSYLSCKSIYNNSTP